MTGKPMLPQDLKTYTAAVSDAIAAEDLQQATTLLQECTEKIATSQRSVAEIEQYLQWLRETRSAVHQCREHLALRLSSINASQYGRTTSAVTWSIDA